MATYGRKKCDYMYTRFGTMHERHQTGGRTDAAEQHTPRLCKHRAQKTFHDHSIICRLLMPILTSILIQPVGDGGLLSGTVDNYQMTLWMKRDTELIG